jgi:hypothetical protein
VRDHRRRLGDHSLANRRRQGGRAGARGHDKLRLSAWGEASAVDKWPHSATHPASSVELAGSGCSCLGLARWSVRACDCGRCERGLHGWRAQGATVKSRWGSSWAERVEAGAWAADGDDKECDVYQYGGVGRCHVEGASPVVG